MLFKNETGSIELSLDVMSGSDLNYTWKLHIDPVQSKEEIIMCSIKCETVLNDSTSERKWHVSFKNEHLMERMDFYANKDIGPFKKSLPEIEQKAKDTRQSEYIEAAKQVQKTIHLIECAQLLKGFSKKCGFENNQHWMNTPNFGVGVGERIPPVGDLSQMVMNMFLHLISYTVTRARLPDDGMDKTIEWRHAYVLVLWASDKEVDDRKRPTG